MMYRLLLVLCCLAAFANSSLLDEEFELFKIKYNKKYVHILDEHFRKQIYRLTKYKILQHNQKYYRGEVSFKMDINKNADRYPLETTQYNGFRMDLNSRVNSTYTFMKLDKDIALPDYINWIEKGAVTDIKDQGTCGSCWAFSTTGSLEGQHFRKTGKLVSLSEQNLIDCSKENDGCNGGNMDLAFKFINKEGGIDTADSYPYEGDDDKCRFSKANIGADDKGYVDLPQGDEEALKQAVATIGPISVAIDASRISFLYYHTGVYYDPGCSSTELDHGVLVVGYGTDPDDGDYWLVKNSWGDWWGGLSGYIKMSRNRGNNCGIATMPSYPIV